MRVCYCGGCLVVWSRRWCFCDEEGECFPVAALLAALRSWAPQQGAAAQHSRAAHNAAAALQPQTRSSRRPPSASAERQAAVKRPRPSRKAHDLAVLPRRARRVDQHLDRELRPLLLQVEQLGDHQLGHGGHELLLLLLMCGGCARGGKKDGVLLCGWAAAGRWRQQHAHTRAARVACSARFVDPLASESTVSHCCPGALQRRGRIDHSAPARVARRRGSSPACPGRRCAGRKAARADRAEGACAGRPCLAARSPARWRRG